MKQTILHFHSGDYLLVELPEGTITEDHFAVGIVELIGKLSEVTEEKFQQIVDWNEKSQYFTDYRKAGWQGDITATESFYSKMEAEGLYTENPRGSFEDAVTAPTGCAARVPEEIAWEDAEEKTFHPDRSFLFRILNQQQ